MTREELINKHIEEIDRMTGLTAFEYELIRIQLEILLIEYDTIKD